MLIAAPVATALLVAASLRLATLTSTLLAAYLALVANLGIATWVLSPLQAVDRGGLSAVEGLLLAAALTAWWRRGRPGVPPLSLRATIGDPVVAVFAVVVCALLGYELLLAVTTPPNDWDTLTYHLSRVVAWMQHGGVYRIPDAPTPRMNEYQPLAEQQILYLFTATKSNAVYALPQYVAQLAVLVGVYGASRRLGFAVRAAMCASFLFATFSLVTLQVSSAQNDLVAASFAVAALCLVLGPVPVEPMLAGVAVGMGVGAKLTIMLVLPVLLVFGIARGRRAIAAAVGGTAAGFVAVGAWGFVINLANTGHVLGYLGTHIDVPDYVKPLHPSAYATTVDVLYGTLDIAAFSNHVIRWLWIAGIVVGAGVAVASFLRGRRRTAAALGVATAIPFLSPLLMVHLGDVVAALSKDWGFPVRGRSGNVGDLTHTVQAAVFGPVGGVVFLAIPLVTLGALAMQRADWRHVVLALAVPLVYVLLGHETYNYFMTRFLLVPAALVAPLFALFLSHRVVAAAFLSIAAVSAGMVVTQTPSRPLDGRYGFGRPWQLTQVQAAYLTDERGVGDALAAYRREVPPHACVGAVLGSNEPAYLLSGPALQHRIAYLPVDRALHDAYSRALSYVVISTGDDRWAARSFRQDGWTVHSLGGYWLLAVAPHAGDGVCPI